MAGMNNPTEAAADPLVLRDKALNLRESVNSTRARLYSQRERVTRLRAEIAALRALSELKSAAPAAAPPPSRAFVAPLAAPLAVPAPSPLSKESDADSAPAPASFQTDDVQRFWKALPYAAILFLAVAIQNRPAFRLTVPAPFAPAAGAPAAPAGASASSAAAPAAAAEDDRADEALLLVHEFRLPGDETPLSERLSPGSNPPGSRPAWTAERTGEKTYLVRYQASDDAPAYEFDVDVEARRVDPTPATAELIAPRLASTR